MKVPQQDSQSAKTDTPAPEAPAAADPASTPAPAAPEKTEEPEAPEAPAAKADDEEEAPTPGDKAEGEEGEKAAAAAYEAKLKYKVYDKELDFDPVFKDLVKDEKVENKLRELHEKAHGLDIVKPKYVELRQNHQELAEEHQGLLGGIQELRECVQRRDFDSFFTRLKIPHELVLQWLVDKVEYNELPPEQRAVIDARKKAERDAVQARKELESRDQQYFQQASRAKATLLDMALERAEIRAFADAYDAKVGKPGAFRDAVCDYGEAVYFSRKEDLSPDQAIKDVMSHYGKFVAPSSPAASPAAPAQANGQPPTPKAKEPPVIPNLNGKQTSPAKNTGPSSVDDLRKIRQKMIEAQNG